MDSQVGVPYWAFAGLLGLLQALIILLLTKLWTAVERNTAATTALSIDIPTNYAAKKEVRDHHNEDLYNFRRIDGEMTSLRERVTAMDGNLSSARAGLRGDGG